MYRFFNPNPNGRNVGDCVIRAISFLTGQSWDKVFADIAALAYSMKDMPSSNAVWGAYLKARGFKRYVVPDTCPDCYTVKMFCRDYPYGDYLVATGTHVIGISNGDYYDAWDSGEEVIAYYWRRE